LKVYALVLARDKGHVKDKINELEAIKIPFTVICGDFIDDKRVQHREPKGKYDAINFGSKFIPDNTEVVLMNDVDTTIFNLSPSLKYFRDTKTGLVYSEVRVLSGPQGSFYKLLDFIRRRIPVAASGELILIRKNLLLDMIPLKPCKAEDSYIMFKVLETRMNVVFSNLTYVKTIRTQSPEEEENYKRRTVGGLYQALSMTNPPFIVKVFYTLLPFASPLLLVLGKKGYHWMRGILKGYVDYLRGDTTGHWRQTYQVRAS
jgi:hypothetical protein